MKLLLLAVLFVCASYAAFSLRCVRNSMPDVKMVKKPAAE